jgi:molybdopterin-guanine dinucleotide biosynthesis protein A
MAAGVIIAGGEGRRLGGVLKSELAVGGVRLIDRVAARLGGCAPLLVVHGRHEAGRLSLPAGAVAVPDLESEYGGPLAGLAAAVDWLMNRDWSGDVVLSAVDAPFLPDNYVERLLAALGGAPAAVASAGEQPYPTNSAWRLAAIAGLADEVRAGTAPRSLKRLAERLGAASVRWAIGPDGDPFANANTPEELTALETRALATGL